MSGSRRKALRRLFVAMTGRNPKPSEFRSMKRAWVRRG